jgi:hypothetical protein
MWEEGGGNRGWESLHDEELRDMYSSLDIIRVSISRRLTLVAHMGRREVHRLFLWGNRVERHFLEDPNVDSRIILKWIFKE